MGAIKTIRPVKLIVGLISCDEAFLLQAKKELQKRFGKIDFQSSEIPFNYTDYYSRELGRDLKRIFLSFEQLIDSSELSKIKRFTNNLEKRLSSNGKRRVNIDPGYLTQAKLILASRKNFSHRIYLGSGTFAEIALLYKHKTFAPMEWTYPDYRTKDYIEIFNNLRKIYSKQIQCQS